VFIDGCMGFSGDFKPKNTQPERDRHPQHPGVIDFGMGLWLCLVHQTGGNWKSIGIGNALTYFFRHTLYNQRLPGRLT
jgi:hypothetical protein